MEHQDLTPGHVYTSIALGRNPVESPIDSSAIAVQGTEQHTAVELLGQALDYAKKMIGGNNGEGVIDVAYRHATDFLDGKATGKVADLTRAGLQNVFLYQKPAIEGMLRS